MIPLVITAVMAASMIGYRWLGADGDLALHAAQQDVLNTPGASMKTLVGRLEEEAGTQPDNPKVWSLLFPLYQKIGQPGQAIDALETTDRTGRPQSRSSGPTGSDKILCGRAQPDR